MKRFGREGFLPLLFLLVACAMPVAGAAAQGAQSPAATRMALARELVRITLDSTTVARSTLTILEASLPPSVPADQRDQMRRVASAAVPPIAHYQSVAAEVYAELFTADELRELLIFYRSAVGRKSVRLAPEVNIRILTRMRGEAGP